MENSIVVEHTEGADWALVIVCTRSAYGRRYLTPMIFVNADCGLFGACPQLKNWVRGGLVSLYNTPPERRVEILKNAVGDFVRQVSLHSFVKERSKVGIVARSKARKKEFDEPINFFGL